VSRRRTRQPQRPHRRRLLDGWTIQRASGAGVVCGIAAILIAGLFRSPSQSLLYFYALLLAATALCGASVLWITAADMRTRGTSGRMRPIRGFDAALGLALLLPALYALSLIWPQLGF
jgi:hypothetical protein